MPFCSVKAFNDELAILRQNAVFEFNDNEKIKTKITMLMSIYEMPPFYRFYDPDNFQPNRVANFLLQQEKKGFVVPLKDELKTITGDNKHKDPVLVYMYDYHYLTFFRSQVSTQEYPRIAVNLSSLDDFQEYLNIFEKSL